MRPIGKAHNETVDANECVRVSRQATNCTSLASANTTCRRDSQITSCPTANCGFERNSQKAVFYMGSGHYKINSSCTTWNISLSTTQNSLALYFIRFSDIVGLQGEPKNVPTRKLRYLRNAWIFLHQILPISLQDNCARVCCFVLYLLGIRQINGNANFRNEFCNCTEGWLCKSKLNRAPSTISVTTSMRRHYFV